MAVIRCLLALLTATTLPAQSTGGVQGTITDITGAVIASAAVTISNRATGESHTVRTDSAGLYLGPSLIPGTYTVQVESPGMQTVVANDVVVSVSTTQRQDFTLKVASTNQTIVINRSRFFEFGSRGGEEY